MSPRTHVRITSRWPFWLLLAAWFCANSPQAATYDAIIWLGNARHFSHQQRLTNEVVSILAGEQQSPAVATLGTLRTAPDRPFAPPVSPEAALKKIDVLALNLTDPMRLRTQSNLLVEKKNALPAAPWTEPMGEPPRGA
jgi:hypothetical protein